MRRTGRFEFLAALSVAVFSGCQEPEPRRVAPESTSRGPESLEQHLRELRDQLPHDGFTVVVEPPFVVVGDEREGVVRARAENTVRWAVRMLKDAYFPQDPERILDIWLFKDHASYRRNCQILFGKVPWTQFGYYSSYDGALVMNIATGSGTLVHEIVHPFVEANFPNCPSWFNEGLGSLYEHSTERNGQIVGLVNWRLPIVQRALREGRCPTFEALTATTKLEFYEKDHRGVHYATARYLCHDLQELGLLRRYYATFWANRASDPTGYQTLIETVGGDIDRYRAQWEQRVLALRQ